MGLELMNTAIEAVVDLVTLEKKPLAKIAKDTAAGAVLIAAIMSAAAGLIIFLPKGIVWIGGFFGG
jgi:diacylglycerol kinase (ATP)